MSLLLLLGGGSGSSGGGSATALYPRQDSYLVDALVAGVVERVPNGRTLAFSGPLMSWWLGDGTGDGPIIEENLAFTDATLAEVVERVCPRALRVGSVQPLVPTYTGTHRYKTPREILDAVCASLSVEWRVNPDGTVDVGDPSFLYGGDGLLYPATDLYPAEDLFPTYQVATATIVVEAGGPDGADYGPTIGDARLETDVEDLVVRAVITTEDSGTMEVTVQGEADVDENPYVDPFGQPLQLTRVVDEPEPEPTGAPARAAAFLSYWSTPRRAVDVAAEEWDPTRQRAGEVVDVYDPDGALVDAGNQKQWRGRTIWPVSLRTRAVNWPVTADLTVLVRHWTGSTFEVLDVTEWIEPESGPARLEVGADQRTLASALQEAS